MVFQKEPKNQYCIFEDESEFDHARTAPLKPGFPKLREYSTRIRKSSVFCCPLTGGQLDCCRPAARHSVCCEDETVKEKLGDVRADDDRWLPLGDSTEGVDPGFRCSLADDDSCAGVLLTQDPKIDPNRTGSAGGGTVGWGSDWPRGLART